VKNREWIQSFIAAIFSAMAMCGPAADSGKGGSMPLQICVEIAASA